MVNAAFYLAGPGKMCGSLFEHLGRAHSEGQDCAMTHTADLEPLKL